MIQTILFVAFVPLLVALAALVASRWLTAAGLRERYAAVAAASLGLLAGYALLPAWAPWQPTTYWHWLLYLGLAAGLVGPLTLASGVQGGERLLVRCLLALLTAWLVVPTWARLEAVRAWHVGGVTVYLLVLIVSLEPLTSRFAPARLLLYLTLSAAALALMTAVTLSLTFGQLGGVMAASLGGTCLAAWLVPSSAGQRALRGLVPWYAVLVGGLAYVGYINPQPRLGGLILIAFAPLALWLLAVGPLARGRASSRSARTAGWVEAGVVLTPILVGSTWVLVATA
jgi:hypothetical protein